MLLPLAVFRAVNRRRLNSRPCLNRSEFTVLFSEMSINTVGRVENKGTIHKSFLTYAVVPLCFVLRRTPVRAIPQHVRRFVQSYLSSDNRREPPKK